MSLMNVDKSTSHTIQSEIEKHVHRFPALESLRNAALQEFGRLGLPGNKSEEYRYTPLGRILEKKFDFSRSTESAELPLDQKKFLIPHLEATTIVLINGVFSPAHSSLNTDQNFQLAPLEKVVTENPALVLDHLGKHADYKADPFIAWNTAAWTSGIFIQVPDNMVIEKPIVIYNLVDSSQGQVLSFTRNLILLGKNSEITILEKNSSYGDHPRFSNRVNEIVVNENAGINLYTIQNDEGAPIEFNQTTIHQANYSRANCYTFTFDGKLIRNNLQLILHGEGCDSHMYGLYLLNNDTIADNHTIADHQKPNSFSNELYKGIMNGSSKGVFNGKIYVRPQAQKTNAFQTNRNIILTDKASVNTKPQLEIWADDVKCSHGCTSGQLDEEALFYLQTRGLHKETAQAMLLYAFAGEVLEYVKLQEVKNYLDKAIGERLKKTF